MLSMNAPPPSDPENPDRRYRLSAESLRAAGVSFAHLASVRSCADCRSERSHIERPDADPNEIIERIATCCSAKPEYILPQTPLMETVFRVYLARRNPTLSAAQLAAAINDLAARSRNPPLDPCFLALALCADQHYGITPIADPT